MSSGSSVTLVSFANSDRGRGLHDTLSDLGYRVNCLPAQMWFSPALPRVRDPLVLFIAQADYPRDRILSVLHQSGFPCLGVSDRDQAPWDSEILGRCSEFAHWPCHRDELALRMQRLLPRIHVPIAIDETALLEEFMHLNLIGRSRSFVEALRTAKKVARCDVPVLIEGETGTGKEMAARAVHYLSARRDHPFIPINCGAIPDSLFESELFGHARGAFTDAKEAHPGLVALADGGTLFLDEVDALSGKGQVALLRFLQDQQYRPLGGREMKRANIRLMAASNSDLSALTNSGQFRADLLFRLKVLSLNLPPLRERGDDVVVLAEHFMERYRRSYDEPHKRLAPEMARWLPAQPWPGNVRELESFIHREFLLADGDTIHVRAGHELVDREQDKVGERLPADLALKEYKARAISELERKYLATLLAETGGNVSQAARRAGKERRALGKLLKKYGINPRELPKSLVR